MKTLLDASHVCLIKQWRTFQTMKRSADEVQQYLFEAAGAAIAELRKRYAPDLKSFNDDLLRHRWFDIYPSELEDFNGLGIKLMRFGVEHIDVDSLTDPNAEKRCRAYAYTPDEDLVIWAQVRSFMWELPLPDGFLKCADETSYIYTAALPTLKAQDFARPAQLTEAFCGPLSELMEWYKQNADAISRFKPKRQRRTKDTGAHT
jgi:hypothetical protein